MPKGQRRYCSTRCRRTAESRRYRARKKGQVVAEEGPKPVNDTGRAARTADGRVSARRPPDSFVDEGWFELIGEGDVSMAQAAATIGTSEANVSRWFEWMKRRAQVEVEAEQWEMGPEAKRALADFGFFRARYFKAARGIFKGKPYATEPFHLRWIDAVLRALPDEAGGTGPSGLGGQQLILSPPRHGKTELLAHFCIWLICRNPDIVIIWIAKAERQAREVGSLIRDNLEQNQLLISEMLGPGGQFKPEARTGAAWRDDEFEVATRTIPQKAPTFRSIGRGGNLQSVDADFIVTDDIEDHDSTRTPHQREATQDWLLTEVESRKERHTAWLCIGSRNHPQDVLAHLLDSEDWSSIVETAHEHECELPVDDEAAHVDCMLWPAKFDYAELAKKIRNSGQARVQMRYLNDPVGDGVVVFTEPTMRACIDRSRVLGKLLLPDGMGYELLGSIDPSPGVYQIGQLWAWSRENPVRYLLDISSGRGGMDAWEALCRDWLTVYGLRRWVVEANSTQADYVNRREFATWRSDNGVHVHPHKTGINKHSAGLGVASMHPLYVKRHIVLPYGDHETQGKVDKFIAEHVGYDPDRTQQQRKWRIDRVMAAWFANVHIDTLQGGRLNEQDEEDAERSFLDVPGDSWVATDQAGGWFS